MLKKFCSWVDQNTYAHNTIKNSPITQTLVKRFVSGTTREESLQVAENLVENNFFISLDYLGENNLQETSTKQTVTTYLELLHSLENIPNKKFVNLEISVKLSAIGSCLQKNSAEITSENAYVICSAAKQAKILLTFDMEDHTTTDNTISLVEEMRKTFPETGIVLQSYLHRTEQDCIKLATPGSRIRLCKGSYNEPHHVAYQKKHEVDAAYLRCLKILMSSQCYPMVASHDPKMVEATNILATLYERDVDSYEHQMLLGVAQNAQKNLLEEGKRVRIYLPYGDQWYEYFMRRILERPANMIFFMRSLLNK